MALRKQPLAAGVAALVFSSWAAALGLGEITLNSALNEPLDAEIQLLNVGNLSEAEIIAGLASREDFSRAGVEREFVLNSLNFDIDLASASPVIRVTSRDPIREPYLDFLVNLEWTSGRLLREYTLLLDLPVFSRDATVKKPAAAPAARPDQGRTTAAQPPASALEGGATYTVASGDTLWRIASQLSGNGSVHQKMAAIQAANPEAFIDGDINLLRRGAVLRLPAGQDVAQADPATVASQLSAGRNDEAAQPVWNAQPESASPRSGGEDEDSARLSLAVDSAGPGRGSSASGGAGTSEGTALRGELDLIQEELERSQRENAELKARLSNLESQLGTMERMLELGSDDMRAGQLAAAQSAAEENALDGSDAPDSTGPDPATADVTSDDGDTEAPATATAAQDAGATMTTEKTSSLAMLQNYLAYVVGAVLLLIAALVVVVVRRRNNRDVDFSEIMARRDKPARVEPSLPVEDEAEDADDDNRVASVDDIELDEADDFFSDRPEPAAAPDTRQPESLEEMELDLAEFDLGEAPAAPAAVEPEVGPEQDLVSEQDETLDLDLPEEPAAPRESVVDDAPRTAEIDLDDFDFLGDSDAAATQLELARAYIDMGDKAGARDILEEVAASGNEDQKEEARTLLSQLA